MSTKSGQELSMRRTSTRPLRSHSTEALRLRTEIAEVRARIEFIEGRTYAQGEFARLQSEHDLLVANYAILAVATATLILDLLLRFVRS